MQIQVFLLKSGTGIMYYKIRIENQDNLVPQLSKNYLKYYDRLTIDFY